MAKKKASAKKNSLVGNINKRKKAGKSRSKKKSTVSKQAYSDMQKGWPKKKGTKKKAAKKKSKPAILSSSPDHRRAINTKPLPTGRVASGVLV